MEWTAEAEDNLRRISRRQRLTSQIIDDLRQQAEQWAQRRIADSDAKGYDDDPRAVIDSDVGYSWAYMQLCMPRNKQP